MAKDPDHLMWGKYSTDDVWKLWLTEGNAGLERIAPAILRALHVIEIETLKRVPSDPRCVSCEAPFKGIGAPFMRAIGRPQSHYNPSLCASCENMARKLGSRAEVPLTMLFADVRGSTSLAEQMGAVEFSSLINRFYTEASNILVKAMGLIDKLIGDEASAFFVPGVAGERHASAALEAAKQILKATGHEDHQGPWVPVGIGIHSGPAVVGAVGQPNGITDITVLGDTANTAARLASNARAGEIIFSDETARQAGISTDGLVSKALDLKGKKQPVNVWVQSLIPLA